MWDGGMSEILTGLLFYRAGAQDLLCMYSYSVQKNNTGIYKFLT
jgi:hypothetical protein